MRLEDDQDCDKAVHLRDDEQRIVNRVAITNSDNGSFGLPSLFIAVVLLFALFQFELRAVFAEELGLGAGAGPKWANALFVLIFCLTQGLALMFGYRFGFIGIDSKRAYEIIGGRKDYNDYRMERDPMISRADESLTSLYAIMKGRYNNIKPESLNFLQRLAREDRQGQPEPPAQPAPPAIEAKTQPENVVPISPEKAG